MDLLTTYTHDSELQVIKAPPLNSTTRKSPTPPAKPFPACCVFTSRSLTTDSNSGDSSASRPQLLSSQSPVQNSLKPDNFVPCLYHLGTDHIKTPPFHRCSPAVALLRICCLATETCLPSRCPETVAFCRVTA
jgi:hypothetical protein